MTEKQHLKILRVEDWEGWYLNGSLVYEGDSMCPTDVVFTLQKMGLLPHLTFDSSYIGGLPENAFMAPGGRGFKAKLDDVVDNQYQALWQKAAGVK